MTNQTTMRELLDMLSPAALAFIGADLQCSGTSPIVVPVLQAVDAALGFKTPLNLALAADARIGAEDQYKEICDMITSRQPQPIIDAGYIVGAVVGSNRVIGVSDAEARSIAELAVEALAKMAAAGRAPDTVTVAELYNMIDVPKDSIYSVYCDMCKHVISAVRGEEMGDPRLAQRSYARGELHGRNDVLSRMADLVGQQLNELRPKIREFVASVDTHTAARPVAGGPCPTCDAPNHGTSDARCRHL